MNNHILSQTGNTDETPAYFGTPSNHAVDHIGAKYVVVKTSGNKTL
jgi:hypothetical protein